MPRQPTRRGRHGGRWLLLTLVAALLWVSGCGDQPDGGQVTSGLDTPGTSFDPPAGFDLTRAVTLTQDQALHGTLHGTTLFSFAGGALTSIDLPTGRTSWSVDLSADTAQDYLYPPHVVDGTVVLATGQQVTDATPQENYTINLIAANVGDGTVLWQKSFPVFTLSAHRAELQTYGHYLTRLQDLFIVKMIDRDDGLLVSIGPFVEPFTTVLLDLVTGQVRWQADLMIIGASTGQYAVAASASDRLMAPVGPVALDLETGQMFKELSDPLDRVSDFPLADPDGNFSSIAAAILPDDSPTTYLRMSSADATVEQFVPATDDVRYTRGLQCFPEEAQAVMLCRGHGLMTAGTGEDFRSAYGVEAATGQVVWSRAGDSSRMDYATQHHGHVYGTVDGRSVVLAMNTGEIVNRDTGIGPLRQLDMDPSDEPVKVNEYGMVGMVKSDDSLRWADTYVWAPANR